MSLVALDGTPLVPIGTFIPWGSANNAWPTLGNAPSMAVANKATIFIGYVVTEDGGSHTIDTTGSSALSWRTGGFSPTLADAGSTLVIGLATVDTTAGPPGRATNVAGVITSSVAKVLVGSGSSGIAATTWYDHVPTTGTMTVANGDLIAFFVQLTTRGGSDTVTLTASGTAGGMVFPEVVAFDASTYVIQSQIPNCLITFSDGKLGWFAGSWISSADASQVWNNTSGTKEYGNYFLMPFPTKIYGIYGYPSVSGDCDFILYSDPLGTPAAQKTISVDLNTVGGTNRTAAMLFASPYTTTASQPLAVIMKPTSATNVTAPYRTFNASNHQKTDHCGTNCYAVNRASGAFAAQNSNKDRFGLGVLVGAWDDGTGGGSAGMLFIPDLSGT